MRVNASIGILVLLLFTGSCSGAGSGAGGLGANSQVFIENSSAPKLTQEVYRAKSAQFVDYLDAANPQRKSTDYYRKRLGLIGRRVLPGGPKSNIDLKVYDSARVEIYSPGANAVRITTASMDLLSDDELAAVIAQQLARLKLGQSKRRFEAALDLVPDGDFAQRPLTPEQLLSLEKIFFRTAYSIEQLEKSDDYAYLQLKKKGYSADTLGSALKKLGALPSYSRYAAAHPGASERAERREVAAAKNTAPRTPAVMSKTAISRSPGKSSTLSAPSARSRIEPKAKPAASTRKSSNLEAGRAAGVSAAAPGWYVQVESLQSRAEADRKSVRLFESGYQAVVQRAVVDGVEYYRVLVGPFKSKTLASDRKSAVAALGISKDAPFLKRIK